MKKLVLVALSMACAVSVFAQGQIQFNNTGTGIRAPIYGPEVGNPFLRKSGNTATGNPAGTQTYTGPLLAGAGWTAELWGGPLGTEAGAMTPAVNGRTTFRTGAAAGFVNAPNPAPAITGVPENGRASLQVRAWDNRGGTIASWAQVQADPTVARGTSDVFASAPLGGTTVTPPPLTGITSFNVAAVPEPSTIALGVLGAIGALMIRRRK